MRVLGSDVAALAFKVAYLLLAFLSFNSLIANLPAVSYVAYVVAAFGLLVLAARIARYRRFAAMPLLPLLGLFWISFIVSTAFSLHYGVSENIQGLIWLTLEFGCLYACDVSSPRETLRRDMSVFAFVFVGYTCIASLVGVYMGLAQYQDGFEVRFMIRNIIGMFQGRLFGLYSDPNYGAVYGLVSILFSWWLYLSKHSGGRLAFACANTAIQLVYIGLTGSRTGVYGALVTAFIVVFLVAMRSMKGREGFASKTFVRGALSLAGALVLVVGLFAGFKGIERAYLVLSPVVQQVAPFPLDRDFLSSRIHLYESPETIENEQAEQEAASEDSAVTSDGQGEVAVSEGTNGIGTEKIGLSARVDVEDDDVSNGRFAIWKSGLEIFSLSPLIGVSHRCIPYFAAEHLPDTYIVREGFTTLHSVLVDVLAAQGLFGFIVIAAFVVLGLKAIAQGLVSRTGEGYYREVLLVGVLAAIGFSSLFYSEILYINTVGSVVFWTVSGYLMVRFAQDGVRALSFGRSRG